MTKSQTNPKVDAFLSNAKKWQEELKKLRKIILDLPLTEELKWGKPCYAFQESNVVIVTPLKESCAVMFCKGALLKDAKKILIKPGEHTQAGRWLKFTSAQQVDEQAAILKAYLQEAIEAEKAGLKVTYKKPGEFTLPEEFKTKLEESPDLKRAFYALTPGRQRAYLLHFSGAKQAKTRESRIEKCRQPILEGKGFNE